MSLLNNFLKGVLFILSLFTIGLSLFTSSIRNSQFSSKYEKDENRKNTQFTSVSKFIWNFNLAMMGLIIFLLFLRDFF